ncbi:MAG: hypothetical protein Q8R83_10160 [Legionellaceae bacterium]|nr:hypothetical protein [Legionellaceae bacterium]
MKDLTFTELNKGCEQLTKDHSQGYLSNNNILDYKESIDMDELIESFSKEQPLCLRFGPKLNASS